MQAYNAANKRIHYGNYTVHHTIQTKSGKPKQRKGPKKTENDRKDTVREVFWGNI